MIEQLSIYTENKKGAMREILSLLSKEDINVLGFVNNDSAEFGTVRLILSDTDTAFTVLTANGYLCRRRMVIGVAIEDTPGAMESLLEIIEHMNINVNYMYLGYKRENSMPIILISCTDLDIVSKRLDNLGYTVY